MKSVSTAFRNYRRVRPAVMVSDDTGWPKASGLVQVGFESKDGQGLLLELTQAQAISLAEHLLSGVVTRRRRLAAKRRSA